jgi:hypothetical protein
MNDRQRQQTRQSTTSNNKSIIIKPKHQTNNGRRK